MFSYTQFQPSDLLALLRPKSVWRGLRIRNGVDKIRVLRRTFPTYNYLSFVGPEIRASQSNILIYEESDVFLGSLATIVAYLLHDADRSSGMPFISANEESL